MPNLHNSLYVLSNTTRTNVYIETGCLQGMGIYNVINNYDSIHSIELSEHWYHVCREKYKFHDKVHIHLGDSMNVLPELLMIINEPVTVYLDAHYSGGNTAFGEEETPLLYELESLKRRKYDDVIIIDDTRMLGKVGESGIGPYTGPDCIYPVMNYDWSNVTTDKVRRLIKDNYIHLQNTYGLYTDGAHDQMIFIKNNTVLDTNEVINNFQNTFHAVYSDLETKFISTKRNYETLFKAIQLGGNSITVKYSRNKVTYFILNSIFEDNYVARGPIILSTLPYYDEFSAFDTKLAEGQTIETILPYFEKGMIPPMLMPYMNYDLVQYSQTWSHQLIDAALKLAKERTDISPEYHEYAALDFYSAFTAYPIDNKKVLVHNSICPWVEAIALAHHASEVTTWALSDIVSQSQLIKVLKPIDVLEDYKEYFDVVVSYSNIGSEGLGKHGDVINPFGDFGAMREINSILKENGILFLGIAVASIGYVNSNLWRSYSKQRLTKMIEASGFKIIHVIQDHYPYYDNPNITNVNGLMNDWQNLPLIILQKID